MPTEYIATPSLEDLGLQGFQRGALTTLQGPSKSGKTELFLTAVERAQSEGLRVAYFDSANFTVVDGEDVDGVAVYHLRTVEDLRRILLEIRGNYDLVIVDDINLFEIPLEHQRGITQMVKGLIEDVSHPSTALVLGFQIPSEAYMVVATLCQPSTLCLEMDGSGLKVLKHRGVEPVDESVPRLTVWDYLESP